MWRILLALAFLLGACGGHPANDGVRHSCTTEGCSAHFSCQLVVGIDCIDPNAPCDRMMCVWDADAGADGG